MKKILCVAILAAVAAAGCTNKQGETEAPVFVTVDIPNQPGFMSVSANAAVQILAINLASHFKNPTATDPQHFADIQINAYKVHWVRTDGGTLVPKDETFGAGVLLPSGGIATLNNFPILTQASTQMSPFDQLLPFNGGVDRETGRTEIDLAWEITFFGNTASGLRVQSETARGILLVTP
jgi:hypothetical protein